MMTMLREKLKKRPEPMSKEEVLAKRRERSKIVYLRKNIEDEIDKTKFAIDMYKEKISRLNLILAHLLKHYKKVYKKVYIKDVG